MQSSAKIDVPEHAQHGSSDASNVGEYGVVQNIPKVTLPSTSPSPSPSPSFSPAPSFFPTPVPSDAKKSANERGSVDQAAEEIADEWYYIDESGITQGPFASAQMREWYTLEYLSSDLMVRRGAGESAFRKISDLYTSSGTEPFT